MRCRDVWRVCAHECFGVYMLLCCGAGCCWSTKPASMMLAWMGYAAGCGSPFVYRGLRTVVVDVYGWVCADGEEGPGGIVMAVARCMCAVPCVAVARCAWRLVCDSRVVSAECVLVAGVCGCVDDTLQR